MAQECKVICVKFISLELNDFAHCNLCLQKSKLGLFQMINVSRPTDSSLGEWKERGGGIESWVELLDLFVFKCTFLLCHRYLPTDVSWYFLFIQLRPSPSPPPSPSPIILSTVLSVLPAILAGPLRPFKLTPLCFCITYSLSPSLPPSHRFLSCSSFSFMVCNVRVQPLSEYGLFHLTW